MPRSTIITVVVVCIVVVVAATLVLGRYLTPTVQQRVVEQQARPKVTASP